MSAAAAQVRAPLVYIVLGFLFATVVLTGFIHIVNTENRTRVTQNRAAREALGRAQQGPLQDPPAAPAPAPRP